MALLKKGKYSECEINSVKSRVTGARYAQLSMKVDEDANGGFGADGVAELGMLLVYDRVNGVVRKPLNEDETTQLHYSEEIGYYDHLKGQSEFAVGRSAGNNFDPRLYELDKGDTFTTNAVSATDFSTVKRSDYFTQGTDGFITHKGSTLPVVKGTILQLDKIYTMPSGRPGYKFVVIQA